MHGTALSLTKEQLEKLATHRLEAVLKSLRKTLRGVKGDLEHLLLFPSMMEENKDEPEVKRYHRVCNQIRLVKSLLKNRREDGHLDV